ncbi:MAG TPA: tripartite tricarboxylate transporter substrate binding protein [Xanthobacteraceae bacterium]|jgi:tripartite-type tricarboxylate transporter receptor subunit TctC|nr:tripartite tricarboxylate transporter substrate binding protein [Xanthobacteraceae bacterium]
MRRTALILAMLALAGPAPAQSPQKPIEIIVPFAPGASADGIARLIGQNLALRLGRPVTIENKAGAGGTLGLVALAKSPPDGDTLAIGATGALVISPNLPGASFDPLRELAPVARLIEIPIVVVANRDTGPQTIAEMIARSKQSPNGLSYGSTGVNSGQHLVMEFLKKATGAHLVHVPYRGSAPAVTDLLGGQIPLASVDLTSALPHIAAGRLIALGVPSPKRTSLAPDIPTIAEAGVPGFARAAGFIGLFAPAGTPRLVVRRLSVAIGETLATPDAQAKVRLLAAEPAYADDETFAAFLATESARWKESLAAMPASN